VVAGISIIVLDNGIQSANAQNPNPNPQGSGSPYAVPPGQNPQTSGSPYGQFVRGGVLESNDAGSNWGKTLQTCSADPNCNPDGFGYGDRRANPNSNLDGDKYPPTRDEAVSGGVSDVP
jgi:hypothetical protein